MSINWKKSAELNGMSEDEAKKYFERFPKSNKKVVAVCEGGCGCPDRIVSYYAYHDLCQSCAHKKSYQDDPTLSQRIGEGMKKAYQDDPTLSQRQSKATNKRYENPEERKKIGDGVKKAHRDDPTLSQRLSEGHKKSYRDDPTLSQRQTESMKNTCAEMADPGQEICMHHYIYDFNDLEKYTIPVTRSEHTTIHHNLRRAGLEVPCINILKDE